MKNWQTIVKENNLAVSEKMLSDVFTLRRFDAEYFQPEYLQYDEILSKKSAQSIANLVMISDGNHLGISQYFTENDNGIPYYRGQDVNNFLLEASNPLKISEEIYDKGWMCRSHFQSNDILLSIVGTVGSLSFVTDRLGKATGSCKIAILRPKDISETKTLVTFLLSKYGQYQLKRMTRGAVQTGIILEDIPFISVPVIPSGLKKKITECVDKAIEVERLARLAFSEAEQLLLKEINLEGYVPSEENTSVRELTECLKDNRFDAEYWQVEFDAIQDTIKKNKDGFDMLDNLFEIDGEKITIDLEKEYLYAELADVNKATGTIDNLTLLKGADLPSRGRMRLRRNDLIVSSVEGSLEKIALVSSDEKNIVGSTGFFVLRAKEYEPEVALALLKLKPIQRLLKRQAQGTILTAILKSSLSRVLLPKINATTQQKVKSMVFRSHKKNQEAKMLLEKAKRAVEIFIEKDEQEALEYLEIND